jgi:hypothetical protein
VKNWQAATVALLTASMGVDVLSREKTTIMTENKTLE